jgi:NADH-quinone oxidoreductase subunit G
VLNARIRKAWINGADVALVGEAVDLTYDYYHLANDRAALAAMLEADLANKTGHAGARDRRAGGAARVGR